MKENSPTIMLVYLGNKIPRYVFMNLKLISQIFDKHQIVFITSKKLGQKEKRKIGKNISNYTYQISKDSELRTSSYHDIKFRNGFWNYTIERLFAATSVIIKLELDKVLLVEADVLLGENFPMHQLCYLQKLTWGAYNESRDVGALIYIPSRSEAKFLQEHVSKYWSAYPMETDMEILRRISGLHPSDINYWPDGIPKAPNLKNNTIRVKGFPYDSQLANITGIFDVAALGMWIGGVDPRNNFGWTCYFSRDSIGNGDSFLDPSKGVYRLHQNRILVKFNGENIIEEVHTLHIHSKRPILFSRYRFYFLKLLVGYHSKIRTRICVLSISTFLLLVYRKCLKTLLKP